MAVAGDLPCARQAILEERARRRLVPEPAQRLGERGDHPRVGLRPHLALQMLHEIGAPGEHRRLEGDESRLVRRGGILERRVEKRERPLRIPAPDEHPGADEGIARKVGNPSRGGAGRRRANSQPLDAGSRPQHDGHQDEARSPQQAAGNVESS